MAYKSRGFIQTGGLLKAKIRAATETRGFAETRLLTNWKDIAGPATASICRPVKVSYGKQGFGATLTLFNNRRECTSFTNATAKNTFKSEFNIWVQCNQQN